MVFPDLNQSLVCGWGLLQTPLSAYSVTLDLISMWGHSSFSSRCYIIFFFFLSNQNYSGITEKWNQDPLKTMDIVPLKPRILNTLLLLIVWYAVPTTQSHHFQWGFKSFGNGFGKQSRILCFYHFLFLYETNSKQYFWMPHCMTR